MIKIQRGFSEPKGIVIEASFEGFLSEEITTDEFRLQQVILKLLQNAIKFSDRGSRVDIKCRLRNSDG